jgi:phage replication O-like protein O
MSDRKKNGYTSVPNAIIDDLMAHLSGAEYKVLNVVLRKTVGWRKHWDKIPLSQFTKLCGLSKPGVMAVLDSLVEKKLILCRKINADGKLPENWYALYGETNKKAKLVNSVDQSSQFTGKLILLELVNSVDHLTLKLVNSVYPQKKEEQKKTKQTSSVGDVPSVIDPEPPVLTIKSDATIVEGAILNKYRSQIADRPPAPAKIRDALEVYRVDQLTEAIDRMPLVLKPKKPTTVVDGNYVLALACGTAKNPGWWNGEEKAAEGPDELQALYEHRISLENERKRHGDHPDLLGYIADNEAEIARLEERRGTT